MSVTCKDRIVATLVIGLFIGLAIGASLHQRAHSSKVQTMRATALPVTVQQAAPIIAAVELYIDDHGIPPDSLDSLIPRYLSQLPDAGPVAENGWHYSTDVGEDAGEWTLLVWVGREYSDSFFSDRFVFHPSGVYPTCGYEGTLLPAWSGEWGYYAE